MPITIHPRLRGPWNLPRWRARWQWQRPNWIPVVIVATAYTILGVALILQPGRFDATPSYGNLLDITSQAVWGLSYLGVAALLAISLGPLPQRLRWITVFSHTVALALTATWLAAFIIRYLTDHGTTIVNPISWTVYFALLVWSVLTIADRQDSP